MSQDIVQLASQVTTFIAQTPHLFRSPKNIAKRLDMTRKQAKAALRFATQMGDLGLVLKTPLNTRKKRPTYTTPDEAAQHAKRIHA